MPQASQRSVPFGVTIAIPNWNHEYVLPRSIRSALEAVRVLHDHGVSAEVLVVDDGSRDGSVTLLRQLEALYFDQGLRVVLHTHNSGRPAATRNLILAHASYQYIVYLDADNELLSANLYHFYRAAQQTAAAVVYGNIIRRDMNDQTINLISNESVQDRLFQSNYIDALALIDRTQLIDLGGYSEQPVIDASEDWELYLHYAVNGRLVIFVPLIFGFYYILPLSMTDEHTPAEVHGNRHRYLQRVYDQLGLRHDSLMNTRHRRYHPDLGFI